MGGLLPHKRANIALDGMEEVLSQYQKVKEYKYFDKKKGKHRTCRKKSNRYGFIRYADDFLVTAQTFVRYRSYQTHTRTMAQGKRTEIKSGKNQYRSYRTRTQLSRV